MTAITILIIPADASKPTHLSAVEPGLELFQELVGGWIEQLPGRVAPGVEGHSWLAYVNEEGKIIGLPVNDRATAFMHSVGGIYPWDTINGNMIIIGDGGEEGVEYADVPAQLVQVAATTLEMVA